MGPQPAEASLAMPPKRPPDSLGRPLNHGRDKVEVETGCGAAWLARLSGGQEVPGSNPGTPTGISPGYFAEAGLGNPPVRWETRWGSEVLRRTARHYGRDCA